MSTVARFSSSKAYIAVVADNPETIDGLDAYLRGVGVASKGTRELGHTSMVRQPQLPWSCFQMIRLQGS